MNSKDNFDDVLFMSSGQFDALTDTESFVFSHIAFFACQLRPYKRQFKQTTQAICNKVGYSPNAVRAAISSLIKKGFLKNVDAKTKEQGSYHPYFDKIAHQLQIGENEYALLFAQELEKTLIAAKSKRSGSGDRIITFFKVRVGQLKRNTLLVSGNGSKHIHKALILHGYLHNQHRWNVEKNRNSLRRAVPFLAQFLNWSQNTVRRVINTLKNLGIVIYEYSKGLVKFLSVKSFNTEKKSLRSLETKLSVEPVRQVAIDVVTRQDPIQRTPKSPKEAAQHLQYLKHIGRI